MIDEFEMQEWPESEGARKFKTEIPEFCCICGEPIEGYGNNAEPVCSGRCCDACNTSEVIPARLKAYRQQGLTEDTIKQNGKWVNKGEEGTHGEFRTKKAADAQRKAMFANGYKECLTEEIDNQYLDKIQTFIDDVNQTFDSVNCYYDGDKHTINIELGPDSEVSDISNLVNKAKKEFNRADSKFDRSTNTVKLVLDTSYKNPANDNMDQYLEPALKILADRRKQVLDAEAAEEERRRKKAEYKNIFTASQKYPNKFYSKDGKVVIDNSKTGNKLTKLFRIYIHTGSHYEKDLGQVQDFEIVPFKWFKTAKEAVKYATDTLYRNGKFIG